MKNHYRILISHIIYFIQFSYRAFDCLSFLCSSYIFSVFCFRRIMYTSSIFRFPTVNLVSQRGSNRDRMENPLVVQGRIRVLDRKRGDRAQRTLGVLEISMLTTLLHLIRSVEDSVDSNVISYLEVIVTLLILH